MSIPFSVVREIPTILQQDYAYARNAWENPIVGDDPAALTQKRDRSIRIGLILTRAVALLAVVYQLCKFCKALNQGKIKLSAALVAVVFCHEIFVLANNTTKLLLERRQGESSVVQTLRNLGRTVLDDMTTREQTSNPLTDGTCFPFLWNPLIHKITEERQQQPQNG